MEDSPQRWAVNLRRSSKKNTSCGRVISVRWSWFSASSEDMIWSSELGQQRQCEVDYNRVLLLMSSPVFSLWCTTLNEWEAENKKRRQVKPLYKSSPLISCLRRSVKCFRPWPSMPRFYISEMQQSEVKTASNHFNSAFVLEAHWNRFLTE